ncbi:MAG: HRDC domain-containing protein [Planctomycetota bacterium]|jgi:ribonuclease D|nr:HRDC domain-containing protein [Planctomycetota bacterium]MDP6763189.1 HRDC domain-containing protein [Planctomycetota bacterium]MDP6989559.1 HRDC domain-containing protein [Planctomycetota bacterium]
MQETLPDPTLVEDAEGLEELLGVLEGVEELAVDTEADSFFSYREKVCLIQITAAGRDFLVDPLADVDITPLGAVLADPARVKVFHDGEYDVLLFKREYGFEFANLFDTRIAVAALGSESPGLASVLGERFGVSLDKSLQRSDWSSRPLSARQIAYARLDTHYLLPLMELLQAELEESGRTVIVEGECRRLESLDAAPVGFRPDDWARIKGARALSPVQRRNLCELYALRDRLAEDGDLPPFKVMGNATLLELASRAPRDERGLENIGGLSKRLVRRFGRKLLEALVAGRTQPPITRMPERPSRDGSGGMSVEEQELLERLKTWRSKRARSGGFDASLVLNRHTLPRIVRERPRTVADLAEVTGVLSWQVERYGDSLVDLVRTWEDDLAHGRIDTRRRRR